MESNWQSIGRLLMEQYNLDVSRYDKTFLGKTIQNSITGSGRQTINDYAMLLKESPGEASALYQSLGISYTEFFRNSLTFGILEHIVFPKLIQEKSNTINKEIRIWSAACASGQEAYSLAMLLEELKNGNTDRFSYRIFASDISEAQIRQAKSGVFNPTVMQQITMHRIDRWFDRDGEKFVIKPQLQKHIDFSVFDVFSDCMQCPPASIFGDFDLVFCANMLFYYTLDSQQAILQKIGKCLSANGYIITGEAERETLLRYGYMAIFPYAPVFQLRQP